MNIEKSRYEGENPTPPPPPPPQCLPNFQHCCGSGSRILCLFDPRIRIRDPVPFWPLDPGRVKNQDPDPRSGFGMNIPDHISHSHASETSTNTDIDDRYRLFDRYEFDCGSGLFSRPKNWWKTNFLFIFFWKKFYISYLEENYQLFTTTEHRIVSFFLISSPLIWIRILTLLTVDPDPKHCFLLPYENILNH